MSERDPKVDPRVGDVLRLRFYEFDETDVEINIRWRSGYPKFTVGIECPARRPSYLPTTAEDIREIELWAFREWAKDATVIHRAEEICGACIEGLHERCLGPYAGDGCMCQKCQKG